MSQGALQSLPVLEWSPAGATVFDPASKRQARGTVADVAATFSSKEVILVIARRSTFIRAVRMPDAPRNEISQILAMQVGQFFPVPGGDLAYDFRLTDDKNAEGRLVVVGAVRTEILKIALAELKAAGLRPKIVVPAAFGSWLLARSLGHDTAAVAEPTAEGLAVDVIADGELRYSRVGAPTKDEAEVDAEICRTFSVAGVSGGDVIAAGGLAFPGAKAKVSASILEYFTTVPAEHIGLSIELPETRLERERRRQGQRVRLVALLVAAAIGVWAFIYFDRAENARAADRIARSWRSKISKAKAQTKTADAVVAKQKAIGKALDLAFRPAQRFSDILAIAGNVAPGSIWLTGISADRGRPITMRGIAVNSEAIAAYLQRLTADPRFRDVKLVFANNSTIEEKPVVQFSISATAVGNLPLFEKKTGVKK